MGVSLEHPFVVHDQVALQPLLDSVDAVCLFGGEDATLLSWVEQKPERLLVLIETEASVFLGWKAGPLASHPQLRLFLYKEGDEEILESIAWELLFLRVAYCVAPGACLRLAHVCFSLLDRDHQGVNLLASEYRDWGVRVMANVLDNLSLLPRSRQGLLLKDSCRGSVAVLCGAGPSLVQALPILKQIQEHALIVAGGRAIQMLRQQGIHPHFAAVLDPGLAKTEAPLSLGLDTPLFYQSRADAAVLKNALGPLLWMPSYSLLPLESFVLQRCGWAIEPFDAGWTVANFCASLALHLGCETLLCAGIDFVDTDPQLAGRDGSVELDKRGVYSRRDWLMSADWMRDLVQRTPLVRWFSVTTPPLDLLQLPFLSLEQGLREGLFSKGDVSSRVRASLARMEQTPSPVGEAGDRVKKEVQESFEMGLLLCERLLACWQTLHPASPMDNPTYLLIQQELELELCYTHCVSPLWKVWKYSLLRAERHPRGQELHRLLFTRSVLESHLTYLKA